MHHSRTNYNHLIGPYDSVDFGDEVSIRSVKADESYFNSLQILTLRDAVEQFTSWESLQILITGSMMKISLERKYT